MKVEVHFDVDKELNTRWENHLIRKGFPFKKKKFGGMQMYIIEINEPMDAFWLGCNSVSIANKLFDSALTITG